VSILSTLFCFVHVLWVRAVCLLVVHILLLYSNCLIDEHLAVSFLQNKHTTLYNRSCINYLLVLHSIIILFRSSAVGITICFFIERKLLNI
jgi:hypothetical protein